MNKGIIVTELIAKHNWDFIMAIGDDYTDEDMFVALPRDAYSINVGMQSTNARYQLNCVDEVLELIKALAQSA
jgi:trehalose 6-phosphate synthase/phosphatase